jgi:bifunctional DNA-binding transcriptional regulator/antitoxin component of YhaV-PrlF toxin-antitoxin module
VRTISLTAKRQATLPAEVCEELGLEPGDKVGLERRLVDGEAVWILRAPGRDWSWFGAAKRYAKDKSHRWQTIERRIAEAMADDDSRP